ncbi:MAG: hypothetical protein GY950_37630 [bacterium]|nr:hypothetical protein [bacterium]
MLNKKNISSGKIAVIVFFGGLGGLTVGIANPKSHQLVLPFSGTEIEIGILADIFFGSMAGLVAYFFLGIMLGFLKDKTETASDWMRLIAISILAGYMGINYLNSTAEKFQELKQELRTTAENVIRDVGNKNIASMHIQGGMLELAKGKETQKKDEFGLTEQNREARERFAKALLYFQLAKDADSTDMTARIEKAKVHRAIAQLSEKMKDENQKNDHIQKAFNTLNNVIEDDPNNARAYYNRACYSALFCLSEKNIPEKVRSDLIKARDIVSDYGELSKKDKDFEDIRKKKDNPRYAKLIKLVTNS